MKDGLYVVDYGSIYGAFVVRHGEVTLCAPVLRNKLSFFKTVATYVPTQQDLNAPQEQHALACSSPGSEAEDTDPPVWRSGCE